MIEMRIIDNGLGCPLVENENSGLSYNVGVVNYRNLTEHLDELYTKIAELEARLEKLE